VEQTLAKKKYESPRQLERQANILAATRDMLAEVGYSATTMRGLAHRAQVAPGTLYNLYKSKDALVFAAVEDLLNGVAQRVVDESVGGLERILALVGEISATVEDAPAYAEAIARALFRVEKGDPLIGLLYTRSLPFLEEQIEIAKQRGQLNASADARVIARQLQAQSWGIVMAWVMGMIGLADVRRENLRCQVVILLHEACGEGKRLLQTHADQTARDG
jgi:AcrR family transcriptional regulator